jgi:hypothetical protein
MAKRNSIRSNPDTAPQDDLVSLDQFQSRSEIEVVVALLKDSGIPVVVGGLYNLKAPKQVLVPRRSFEAANRVIANARNFNATCVQAEPPPQEPRSIVTAITWVLALAVLIYALSTTGGVIDRLARYLFR